MSEIRVDTISEKTSGSGTTVSNLKNPNSQFRNLIINGDMSIFQRATSTTTVTSGTYSTADRYKFYESTDGAYTTELENLSAADQATTGQKTALELNVTTADGTIGAAQFAAIYHTIEAQNLQHLLYGTSAAKDLTLSFYVKSNKTGTYSIFISKEDSTNYTIPIEYTISSADTWEKKVINISPTAGSTSLITGANGAIANDNGAGMIVSFNLAWGSNYHGSNNTWATAGAAYSTSNQVNWMDSTSNNFFLTGVQLEVGSTATDFEHLPFDVQLQRCSRYFQTLNLVTNQIIVGNATATTTAQCDIQYPNGQMRTSPTITLPTAGNSSNTTAFLTAPGAYPSTIGNHAAIASIDGARVTGTSYSANFVSGYSSLFYSNGTNTFKMDAEL